MALRATLDPLRLYSLAQLCVTLLVQGHMVCRFVCDLLHEQTTTFKGHDRWTVGGVLQPFLINLCEHSYFHNDCFWVKVA
jgi:hypothetical protein